MKVLLCHQVVLRMKIDQLTSDIELASRARGEMGEAGA